MTSENERLAPPREMDFWTLMDHFWALGIGNNLHDDGTSLPWTAEKLELAFDGSPDKRSIENWRSRTNKPSPENIRKLSWIISGGDVELRKSWYDALIAARQTEVRKGKFNVNEEPNTQLDETPLALLRTRKAPIWLLGVLSLLLLIGLWSLFQPNNAPLIQNMRVCDKFYFDTETKKCTKHVSVFVHGIDEVFLSFDFGDVPKGAPFERWWILNGERVAGRSSFNDEAWPGYTFWRPGILKVGQYVVRLIVDGKVTTQTFYVQEDGIDPDT